MGNRDYEAEERLEKLAAHRDQGLASSTPHFMVIAEQCKSRNERLLDALHRITVVSTAIGAHHPTPDPGSEKIHQEPRNFVEMMAEAHNQGCMVIDQLEARISELENLCS